ncbi:MAG: TraY domain-containing protein [Planctomycetota bacterium]|jgi:RHH-type rel operon transcriptional repressor/antitoxin RelB|nr:TraY domain-containing protein [Planctomycetota bacterium]
MNGKMCAIRIPEEIDTRYGELARLTGRTKTFYMRQALEHHLDDIEEAYQGSVIMERVRGGEEELIPLEQWEREQDAAAVGGGGAQQTRPGWERSKWRSGK